MVSEPPLKFVASGSPTTILLKNCNRLASPSLNVPLTVELMVGASLVEVKVTLEVLVAVNEVPVPLFWPSSRVKVTVLVDVDGLSEVLEKPIALVSACVAVIEALLFKLICKAVLFAPFNVASIVPIAVPAYFTVLPVTVILPTAVTVS